MLSQDTVTAPMPIVGFNASVVHQKSRLRILRIIARMNVGGPAIQITGLMKNLDNREFEQLLVTGYCDENEIDYLQEHEIVLPTKKIKGLGQRISLVEDFRAFLEVRKTIKSFEPDIVHTHTAKAGVLGRLATLTIRKKIKRVHTFHGHLLHGYFGKATTKLVILTERFLAFFTHALIAVGEQVKFDLIQAGVGKARKFHVIGPGLQIGELPERKKAASILGISPHDFTVSWIGRAVDIKAPHRILEIARQCKDREMNVRFLFVGDGPLRKQLEIDSQRDQLRVTFVGWQNDIEVVLGASNLVILTSLNEGTPVALIQAQMAGIPVLATKAGSTSEVLLDDVSGYALPYSKELFAARIHEFFINPQKCKDFGEKGRVFAMSKFSTQKLVDSHAELYTKLVNQSNF